MASRFFDRAVLAVLMTVASVALARADAARRSRARRRGHPARRRPDPRAAARSRGAGHAGEDAARRAPQARGRAPAEDRGARGGRGRRCAGRRRSWPRRSPVRRRCETPRTPNVRMSRLASSSLYKLGRAGYWRLLLDVDNLQSIGRAYRTASALTRLDRERVQQHERTLTRSPPSARRSRPRPRRSRGCRSAPRRPRGGRPGRCRADGAGRVHRRAARSERAADRRARSGAAAAAERRRTARPGEPPRSNLPLRPFRGALPWPADGIVTGRFGRQSLGRFGTAISRNGIEISLAEGQARPSGPRRHGRLCRAVHAATATSSSSTTADGEYSLYGYLASMYVAVRGPGRGRRARRHLGPQPQRQPGALLRVTRRR